MFSLAEPIIGEHHDLYNIEATLEEIISLLNDANIEHKSLFLNTDSEFKSKAFGDMFNQKKIIVPNIKTNFRSGDKDNENF